jgi:hypothetical protein
MTNNGKSNYINALEGDLAHRVEQRERLKRELENVEEDIARLDKIIALQREHEEKSSPAVEPVGGQRPRPDFSGLTLLDSIVEALRYFGKIMDTQEITATVSLFGYRFRTENKQGSVAATLSQLVSDERVQRVGVGQYKLLESKAPRQVSLVGSHKTPIIDCLGDLQRRLPFVGLTLFRDRYLPEIIGPTADDVARHDLINEMATKGIIEIYSVPNPNGERDTAAIRLC